MHPSPFRQHDDAAELFGRLELASPVVRRALEQRAAAADLPLQSPGARDDTHDAHRAHLSRVVHHRFCDHPAAAQPLRRDELEAISYYNWDNNSNTTSWPIINTGLV